MCCMLDLAKGGGGGGGGGGTDNCAILLAMVLEVSIICGLF